ncbi:hypothetical protein ROHU_009674 [Labeo rohita]|uniref:Sterile alpha motif domain-containing 3-like n=1 Tax=Labeo rohita TaxID=84645 RepID=A0A498M762_LABRO|nr:hypothetical protein ROHU_009674 [Labeo rohita]
MALLLCVVVSADEARRVHLSQVPESVDALIDALKEKLQLQGDFTLQFEDPDFANALCTLSDISEIPRDRAVLHIKWKIASQLDNSDSQSLGSISSLDTASLNSPVHTSTNPSPTTSSNLRSTSVWPSPFPIPPLSHDVELKLRKANEAYEKTKIGIDVTRDIKTDILDKITQVTFDITAYPRPHEVESIAVALISKYPCLKENDGNGYEGWLTSIRNRFSNFRAKLRVAGCSEVSINSKSKGDGDMTYTLKRAKRGEINHCPNHPNEHDDASLEEQRMLLVEASKKARVDDSLIRVKMDLTFSLRRREVVEEQPMVMVIQNRWPALSFKEQIVEEFFRITNKNLLGTFRAAVEKYTPKLLRLYRSRKASFGKDLEHILMKLDDETSNIIRHRQDAALRGLPIFLREEPGKLFKQCLETDPHDVAVKGVAVGVLYVLEDCAVETSSPKVQNISLIVEESVVLQDIADTLYGIYSLFLFSGLLFLLIIANIVAGVVAFTRSGQMSDDLGEFYKKVYTEYPKTGRYNETIALRFIHNTFDCCGIGEPVHWSVRDTCPEGTSKMLALVCSVVLSRLPKQTHGFSPEFVAYWERHFGFVDFVPS